MIIFMNFFLLFNILLLFNMIIILDEELKEILSKFLNNIKLEELCTPSSVK